MSKDIYTLNQTLQEKSPAEIIKWGLENAKNPVLTTKFRPYEIAILYLCVQAKEDIKIVWCDTGFNTKAIYVYAKKIISELKLNINVYKPKEKFLGEIPGIASYIVISSGDVYLDSFTAVNKFLKYTLLNCSLYSSSFLLIIFWISSDALFSSRPDVSESTKSSFL